MMKRKIYDRLLEWKHHENGKIAILIEGARRVGKSYIVNEFAKNEYKSCIVIDFFTATYDIKKLFVDYLSDLDTFFLLLQNLTGVKLHQRESVIVFDEVQLYPQARAAIKYLVADGRYDYIETGSLVSINKNVKDIVIPSEERRLPLYPMDFEEFLWAIGNEMLMPLVRQSFVHRTPLGPMHRKAMMLFRQYMVVGGMPQAVAEFVETNDLNRVDLVKRDILRLYKEDIEKYASGYETRVKAIFDMLPASLQKHERYFRLADISPTARFRQYETSFFWLGEAQVANLCWGATEPTIGLNMRLDSGRVKCYMSDTGLLMSHAFDENTIMMEKLYAKFLLDKLELNAGMFVENIVAQMLRASGHKLFFFSNYDKQDASENMEIDFLIRKREVTSRHNIMPIEVKSTSRYRTASLNKFRAKYGHLITTPCIIHTADLKDSDDILYLPLYMVPCL